MILALDCATKTGFCILKDGHIYESGTQDFSKTRGESNGGMFLRFRAWLNKLISDHEITLIAYERAHHRGGAATEVCVNLTGRVQECAAQHGIEVSTIPTTTLKKWATGRGNAGKDEMIGYASKMLCRPPTDDNEADAVAIAYWARETYGV